MNLLIDIHNHTIASGHAYSTILEIVKEAKIKGLKMVGITDHGPAMPGILGEFFTSNQGILPPFIHDVEVLRGVEANILDLDGLLDIPVRRLKKLDIVIAGLHDAVIKPWDEKGNTMAIIKALENEYVDIIAHPGNILFPINVEAIVIKARETNKLLEINNGTFYSGSRAGSKENCYEIARLCKKHKVPVIVGSDSHFALDVGRFDKAIELLKAIEMPEELIMNTSVERFKTFLNKRGKKRFSEPKYAISYCNYEEK